MVLKAFYLGNLGHHLDINYNYNQAVPGPGAIAPRMPLYNIAPGVVGDTVGGDRWQFRVQRFAANRGEALLEWPELPERV